MKISIIAVGKIKEKFMKEAIEEYAKRLSKYCDFGIIEVADMSLAAVTSEEQAKQVLKLEAEKIESKIPPNAFLVVMDINGNKLGSEQFAAKINDLMIQGKSNVVFVIGGSLGIYEQLKKRADFRLSMSDFTFPHQMARLMITEQIYRCFKIIRNESYHK